MNAMGRKIRLVLETFHNGGRVVQIGYSQYDNSQTFDVTLWKDVEILWVHEYSTILEAAKKYEKLMKSIRNDQTIPEESQ